MTPPNPPTPPERWTPDTLPAPDTAHRCVYCRHTLVSCGYKRNADGVMRVVYALCECKGAQQ